MNMMFIDTLYESSKHGIDNQIIDPIAQNFPSIFTFCVISLIVIVVLLRVWNI